MRSNTKVDEKSAALILDFFKRYEIRNLQIAAATSLDKKTISEVRLLLIQDTQKGARDYAVRFTLSDACVDIHEYIKTFDTKGGLSMECKEKGKSLSEDELAALIRDFFHSISARLEKIRKEESVQAISYVGNTFTLNHTTFKVLSDDGQGRLHIEILDKGKDSQAAGMSSHALLDGLYSGAIQRKL